MWRVHRLDQITRNIPANLFDSKSFTLKPAGRTDWPVYLLISEAILAGIYWAAATRLRQSGRCQQSKCPLLIISSGVVTYTGIVPRGQMEIPDQLRMETLT